jgi:predicted PurR-regulated permease PerM
MPPAVTYPPAQPRESRGVVTRSRGKLLVLAAATVVAAYLCFRLVLPFFPAIVMAVTIAVVTKRFSSWVAERVGSRTKTAAICTTVVAAAILLPATFLGYMAVQQVTTAIEQKEQINQAVNEWLSQHPALQRQWRRVARDFEPTQQMPQLVDRLQPGAVAAASAPVYIAVQTALALFVLFFLYRDEEHALHSVRNLLPLSEREATRLLRRVADTIHATVFGVIVVAMIQGAMGGAMLALLGIPGAALWGIVMGIMAIIPYLGTFVVWGPIAAFLAFQGEWGQAIVLGAYGLLAIGLIDNLLYPMLVGQRLRQHTVTAFIAILGGVSLSGATGLILGPVLVAATFFLFDTWCERTEDGAAAERA